MNAPMLIHLFKNVSRSLALRAWPSSTTSCRRRRSSTSRRGRCRWTCSNTCSCSNRGARAITCSSSSSRTIRTTSCSSSSRTTCSSLTTRCCDSRSGSSCCRTSWWRCSASAACCCSATRGRRAARPWCQQSPMWSSAGVCPSTCSRPSSELRSHNKQLNLRFSF